MTLYAELLVQTQTRVSVSEPPATAMDDDLLPDGRVSGTGNLELEREMFEFDKHKWEDEMEMRRAEMKSGRLWKGIKRLS